MEMFPFAISNAVFDIFPNPEPASRTLSPFFILPFIFYASPSPRCPQKKPKPKSEVVNVTAVPFGK